MDYVVGLRMVNAAHEAIRKRLLTISLAVNLGLLDVFKHFNSLVNYHHQR